MSTGIITIKGNRWIFCSEEALENWLWNNLERLLQLKPLRRQYFVRGQYCDILAVGPAGQLCILELKNAEDRYVVQQITRYYDALLAEHPFCDQIDYQKPPILIVIAPSYHADTITDLKYHSLDIQPYSFELQDNVAAVEFRLVDRNKLVLTKTEISYPETSTSEHQVASPSRFLLNLLNASSSEQRQNYLHMRNRLLLFDQRMKEIKYGSGMRYGRGIGKPCAQIQLSTNMSDKQIRCYLWLPSLAIYQNRKQILRIEIIGYGYFPDQNFQLAHCPDKTRRVGQVWRLKNSIELAKKMNDAFILESYRKLIENNDQSKNFEILVEIALDNWRE
jgi:RecB family endonuclease NucS